MRPLTLPRSWADRLAYVLMALATAVYAVDTVRASIHSPYWMDEVLAVWTARLPTARAVWEALEKGAEFSPPLFHLLLQKLQQLGGHGRLAMRAPSILAGYAVAVSAFVIVRRRAPPMVAALAFVLCLASGLIDYAVQVRQYALVAACFAGAAVLWDGIERRHGAWPSAAAMGVLLAIAVGLHFYAVLLVVTFGLVELAWSVRHRRVRWPVMTALALAGLSILVWLPILQHVAAFNRGDTAAPTYYARPTPAKLADAYIGLLAGTESIPFSPLLIVSVALIAVIVLRLRTRWRIGDLDLLILATCLIPVIVYIFAAVITHTFNERYGLAAVLGFALLLARCVGALPHPRWTALGSSLLLIVGLWFPLRSLGLAEDLEGDAALVQRAPPGLPIVTGDGLRFLELHENAGPAVAARLVYLTAPNEAALGDPTNEHQVERWKAIDPALDVEPAGAFFARHRSFVMFRDPEAAAEVPSLFDRRTAKVEPIGAYDTATLVRVTLPPTGR